MISTTEDISRDHDNNEIHFLPIEFDENPFLLQTMILSVCLLSILLLVMAFYLCYIGLYQNDIQLDEPMTKISLSSPRMVHVEENCILSNRNSTFTTSTTFTDGKFYLSGSILLSNTALNLYPNAHLYHPTPIDYSDQNYSD